MLRGVLILCILATVVGVVVWFLAARQDRAALAEAAARVVYIVGHRGSCADRPENTLPSFRRAIEAGASAVECDVRTTRDGTLVSSHDADVSRTSNGKGLVGELTFAELRKLDFGGWFEVKYKGLTIPTLQEILELCKGKTDVLLDLKEDGEAYAGRVAGEVNKYGEPKRAVLGVRSAAQASLFRKLLPQSRQIGLIPTPADIDGFAAAGVETVRLWPAWLGDKSLLDQVRKHKLALHLGAGNGTKEEVVPLLRFGPESLSSDDPACLIQTLKEIAQSK
jgi:glycerophosphoryl diester phosphodiesterase